MKGWLDNFGKAENANDSKVSLSEGFVGMGNDTTGRHYSPAWKGQFEDGGIVPIAQRGKKVDKILNQNKHIDWVQGLYDKDYGSIQIPGQEGRSTHFMESADNRVYPTVRKVDGELQYLGDDAYDFADSTKSYIEFPTDKKAQKFAKNYKRGTGVLDFQQGGSIPGSVGFTYARTAGSAPSEGKYAKKTMASAQNGQEMKFYQEGLDWKPKSMQEGGIIEDARGYLNLDNQGKAVRINSNLITMEGVDQDLLGISNTGDTKLMKPGKNYKFKGKKVTEYPIGKNGINQLDAQPKKKLDDLLNFTNYNKPVSSGWLDKFN